MERPSWSWPYPQFHLWTDGLSALLGNPMGSEQTRLDLEQLLTMETKLPEGNWIFKTERRFSSPQFTHDRARR